MITENILKDLRLNIEFSTHEEKKHVVIELVHVELPLRFNVSHTTFKDDMHNHLTRLIGQLYQDVVDWALHGKPVKPQHSWNQTYYTPVWSKEKQVWYFIGEDENEVFTVEEARIETIIRHL